MTLIVVTGAFSFCTVAKKEFLSFHMNIDITSETGMNFIVCQCSYASLEAGVPCCRDSGSRTNATILASIFSKAMR